MKADNDFAVEKKRFVADLFARMASKYPTAIFVDPQRVQCNAGECLVVIDGVPVYSDLHHLTDYGAESLARRYLAQVSDPLRNEQHKTTSGR